MGDMRFPASLHGFETYPHRSASFPPVVTPLPFFLPLLPRPEDTFCSLLSISIRLLSSPCLSFLLVSDLGTTILRFVSDEVCT